MMQSSIYNKHCNQTKDDKNDKEGEFVDTQVKSQGKRYMNRRKEKEADRDEGGMKDMIRARERQHNEKRSDGYIGLKRGIGKEAKCPNAASGAHIQQRKAMSGYIGWYCQAGGRAEPPNAAM
ncbi:hypothetical protein N7478_005045 [Penicillium angulare]|uniref:uncharacterized protein n=1 Tax=Penicillium angulare TaxID=116970 RepID=UPI00253FC84E|nr:uncharacterized protein N7478_005045 [Penicillium angulare]KAJ5279673.1 hypothetical protein N7478_005045 [Penicillium angulare]